MSQTNEFVNLIAYAGSAKALLPTVMVTINISNGACFFNLSHGDRKYGAEPIHHPL